MPQRPPFFPGPAGSARRASGTRGLRPLVGGYRGGHRVSPRGRMHRETAERRAGGPSGWITHPPLAPACRWQGPRSVRAPSPPRAPGECHKPADTPASLAARPFWASASASGVADSSPAASARAAASRRSYSNRLPKDRASARRRPLHRPAPGRGQDRGATSRRPFTLVAYHAGNDEIGRQSLEQIKKAGTPPSG